MAHTSKTIDERLREGLHEDLHAGPHHWDQHKETIRNLYIVKKLTLRDLICEMNKAHGFNATKAQYERRLTRWGFKKNRKKREWEEIAEKVIKRLNEGKDSEVVIDDQIIPSKKLKKEVQRYGRDLAKPLSTQDTRDGRPNIDDVRYSSFGADNAASSCAAIVRSPKLQCGTPQLAKFPSAPVVTEYSCQTARISTSGVLSMPLLSSDVNVPLSPLQIEALGFLRSRHSTQKAGLRAFMKQLLMASSPSNKSLKAAMIPSEYSKLMDTSLSGEDRLSTATNLKIMSTAIFLFQNSLDEGNPDLGRQIFTWFRGNYHPRIFQSLAGRNDPSAFAILEKLFRHAVYEGDSDIVRELLRMDIDPNQRWRTFCSVSRIHTDPKSAIQIACEKKHLRTTELLLDAGARVPPVTDPNQAPLCLLLGGDSPLDLDLVKKLMIATPEKTLLAYPGCLASAIRRKDLKLIELLVEAGVGDNDMLGFSCSQQSCFSHSSEGHASRPCPTHTITFPVLKKLFIAKAFSFLAIQRTNPFYFTPFFHHLLDSVLCQYNQQAVKFMLDAGVCFNKEMLLFLCGIPDLAMISELLSDAIDSFHAGQEGVLIMRIITKLTSTVYLEPMPMPPSSNIGTQPNGPCRNLAKNVAMAQKIAEALTELPAGIKLQCCEALVVNPLWRSLGPQDWAHCKEAFEVIVQASNSNIDSSKALFLIAAKSRDAMGLNRLLDANLNCSAMALLDLLQEVILWGDARIVKRLINELTWIPNIESKDLDRYGQSFLENAISHGNLECVQEIFRSGVGVDFALSDGLGLAISERHHEIVEFLLQSGADPNTIFTSSDLHSTPLSEALASESGDILRLLVRFGANPNDAEALCLASELNTTILNTFLRSCRKEFLVKGGVSALFDAIANSELDTVRLLLRYGVDCDLLIKVGQGKRKTCLAAAIESRNCEILKLIIDAGVNINGVVEQDPRELQTACTALVKAIRCQNLSAMDMLLEAGAEPSPTETSASSVGLTPLQAAAKQGDLDLVQKLLDFGANANEEPSPYGGYTALQITASRGLIGVASLLLERGADVNAKGARRGGRTALETAAENDRIDMVRYLVNSGAHIIGPDAHQYWQAKSLALEHGHFAVNKLLEALYEEKSGGQSPVQVSSLVNFDFSSGIPSFWGLSDESFGLTQIENFGEINDGQPLSVSLESLSWPFSSIPDSSLDDTPDEWSC